MDFQKLTGLTREQQDKAVKLHIRDLLVRQFDRAGVRPHPADFDELSDFEQKIRQRSLMVYCTVRRSSETTDSFRPNHVVDVSPSNHREEREEWWQQVCEAVPAKRRKWFALRAIAATIALKLGKGEGNAG